MSQIIVNGNCYNSQPGPYWAYNGFVGYNGTQFPPEKLAAGYTPKTVPWIGAPVVLPNPNVMITLTFSNLPANVLGQTLYIAGIVTADLSGLWPLVPATPVVIHQWYAPLGANITFESWDMVNAVMNFCYIATYVNLSGNLVTLASAIGTFNLNPNVPDIQPSIAAGVGAPTATLSARSVYAQ